MQLLDDYEVEILDEAIQKLIDVKGVSKKLNIPLERVMLSLENLTIHFVLICKERFKLNDIKNTLIRSDFVLAKVWNEFVIRKEVIKEERLFND